MLGGNSPTFFSLILLIRFCTWTNRSPTQSSLLIENPLNQEYQQFKRFIHHISAFFSFSLINQIIDDNYNFLFLLLTVRFIFLSLIRDYTRIIANCNARGISALYGQYKFIDEGKKALCERHRKWNKKIFNRTVNVDCLNENLFIFIAYI